MNIDRFRFKKILFCFAIVSLIFSFCIYQNLCDDFAEGDFKKILSRILLVVVFSSLITFRIKDHFSIKKDWIKSLFVILFIVILSYPVLSQLSSFQRSISDSVRVVVRNHHSFFDKSNALLHNFSQVYERSYKKYIALSKSYIYLESLAKIYGFGVSPNTNVALGENGFYFGGFGARKVEKNVVDNFDNIADYMGQIPFRDEELRRWKRILEERKYWLQEQGIDYLFVLAPTKAFVYPEHLPNALQARMGVSGTTRYWQLSEYLQKHSDINFLNLLPELLAAKKERDYPLLFYKTDFHWNFYGAFVAYRAIIEKLKSIFPQYSLASPSFSEFDVIVDKHWAHHRFIKMIGLPLSLHKQEHYLTLRPKPGKRWASAEDVPEEGIHDVYPPVREVKSLDGKSTKIRLIRNPDAPLPSIMLLGDSFLEKCVYFFSADAKEVTNFRTVVNFPSSIFHCVKPTIVIQEILNMFILRAPPRNPPGFTVSYLRGKFADMPKNILEKNGREFFQKISSGWLGMFFFSEKEDKDVVQIARLNVKGTKSEKLSLALVQDSKALFTHDYSITEGDNELYFEFPLVAEGSLELRISGETDTFVPFSFEVRKER